MQPRHAKHARRGVTLLEVVLSMGILVFLSSMTYWFYASSLESSRHGTAAAQRLRLVRVILDRIAREIRQAAVITVDDNVGLRGEAERIWISTYRVPTREQSRKRRTRDDPAPPEYDLVQVEYKIVRHPEILHEDNYELPLGLARIEHLVPRPLPRLENPDEAAGEDLPDAQEAGAEEALDGGAASPGDEQFAGLEGALSGEEADGQGQAGDPNLGSDIRWDELYSPEIRYLRFCYYDGNRWWDTWDITGENPLPQLVRVTIGFEPMPPFGEGFVGPDEPNERFCECLNEDPVDCEPLPEDQYSITVRTAHADPLFRSRVSREAQNFVEEMAQEEPEE